MTGFLFDLPSRAITAPDGWPFGHPRLAVGKGASPLEIVLCEGTGSPTAGALRGAWRKRWDGRAAPVFLVVLTGAKASVCGPTGDEPPVATGLEPGPVEQLCREALAAPDRHAAIRVLRSGLEALDTALPGVRNEGLLATHVLESSSRSLPGWREATERALALRGVEEAALLRALGFSVVRHDNQTSVLEVGERRRAVAVLLEPSEAPEQELERFSGQNPVTYALAVADRLNLPWVLLLQGSRLRLYPTRTGTGIAQRGRTETYVEIHTGLIDVRHAGLLWLLFSAEALAEGGTLEAVLEESRRFSGDLAEQLRERIYKGVVPQLAEGLAAARGLANPTAGDLAETYEMSMRVLFRLLFIAYAEDKDLLPFRWNGAYRKRSLKSLAGDLLEIQRRGGSFDPGSTLWEDVRSLFRAVERGQLEWGVPAYGGSLFASDPAVSLLGAELDKVELANPLFGSVLSGLLLTPTPEGLGPVDFRSLGVREFGTIYEGLLESELSLAESDLVVAADGSVRPPKKGEVAEIVQGAIYLHNRSGQRKASGSFYTKTFAVEHLLERSLEPALDEHLDRLARLDDTEAAEGFFDFRVADIAMGSGHFLVAAIDRIGNRLSNALEERRLPGVVEELEKLRASARQGLGDLAEQQEIKTEQLLRRLIARRCIYGVDLNPVAVDLARVSIWIHTFVPGLPLTLLDRNLVHGNSLVGIGQIAEIEEMEGAGRFGLLERDVNQLVAEALEPVRRLGRISDSTAAEVERARHAMAEAITAVAPAEALCDIVAACRLEGEELPAVLEHWEAEKDRLPGSKHHRKAEKALAGLHAFHFPVAFPEVFLRHRAGFDVIVGNPPWEKTQVEEHEFWSRHVPGLRSASQAEREKLYTKIRRVRPDLVEALASEVEAQERLRSALMTGPYPGMGSGHPDLYKAFCWRFWHLVSEHGGRIGVVLPRSALAAKGSTEFRQEVFSQAERLDVTTLLNTKGWVFEEAEHRYTIGLVAIVRREAGRTPVSLRGPYPSLERYSAGILREPAVFYGDEIQGWNDTASMPLLPSDESVAVFAQLRESPRLDLDDGNSWRPRPVQGDLNSTTGKPLMDLRARECPAGYWPVFKGESFDLWTPDTGTYYGWIDPERALAHLQDRRTRSAATRGGAFSGFDANIVRESSTLPCLRPRVAFRRISRATDTRTVRVALVPGNVLLTDVAPYLVWPRGASTDEAYVLGVMASLVFDWYARRFVETHLDFHVLNPLPVPRPRAGDPLRLRVVALAGRLASPDDRFAEWAESIGVECGPMSENERQISIHELDAVVAHLYGLSERQLVHIFETFHEGWAYEARLQATLRHFRRLDR